MDNPNPMKADPDAPRRDVDLDPRPRVTRLNKRALALGIVLLCLVVVAAILSLSDVSREQQERAEGAPSAEATADPFWESQPDGVAQPPAPPVPEREPAEEAPSPPEDLGPFVPSQLARAAEDPEARERKARLRRAMEARPRVPGFQRGAIAGAATPAPQGSRAAPGAPGLGAVENEILRSLRGRDGEPDAAIAQNNQEGKRAFLERAGAEDLAYESPSRVRLPASPYEVVAGSVIPAVLITGANSDLPGPLTAQVRENVYDSVTGHQLLIPQGTRIVGVYDSTVSFGQERLLVAWQRLLFPDGSKLNLGSMPGVDLAGAAGLRDRVNRHTWRIWSNALLLSVLSAGLQLSQEGDTGDEASRRDDVRSTLSASLGQSLGEVVTQTLRRNLNVQPRIEIRPGYRFNVWVQRDLVLPGPYVASCS